MPPDHSLAHYQPTDAGQQVLKQGLKEYPEGWRDPRLGGGSMINVRARCRVRRLLSDGTVRIYVLRLL